MGQKLMTSQATHNDMGRPIPSLDSERGQSNWTLLLAVWTSGGRGPGVMAGPAQGSAGGLCSFLPQDSLSSEPGDSAWLSLFLTARFSEDLGLAVGLHRAPFLCVVPVALNLQSSCVSARQACALDLNRRIAFFFFFLMP